MSKVRILSPRPEINKNAAVNAVFLFISGRTADSNDKILLSCSNLSLGLARTVPNLRGIPDDFAALIVAPTTKFKTVAFAAVFYLVADTKYMSAVRIGNAGFCES